ncbi:MAG: ATP-dependent 6-phosphofructokinase [Spirochaetia bacterium]|nr:ATP-dependent 6-phosphofructokinase [Spirochaetia bacterium]
MDFSLLKKEDFDVTKLGEPKYKSPVQIISFINENERFLFDISETIVQSYINEKKPFLTLERGGPREKIFFNPETTKAAIVTCGGLCPGINNVISAITLELTLQYKIPEVIGYRYGFKGIADRSMASLKLNLEIVNGISDIGGSILGSSRGPQDISSMIDRLIEDNVDILFIIGGDGSMKGAEALYNEVQRRRLKISIIAVPKTIDNDLNFISKSFGFQTAYSKAVESIRCVHTESVGYENGIGIVKVMGRHSGAIAAFATISSNEVNFCLIPEMEFKLEGEKGLFSALHQRLLKRGHAVIVIAEGAAQDIIPHGNETDASGNKKLIDSGSWLRDQIKSYFEKINFNCTIKYIDPSYIIRSVPALPDDALFCTILGQYAAHAGMSGRTGMVIGQWNHFFAHLPIKLVIQERKLVNLRGSIWSSVLESTGQNMICTEI